MNSDIISSILEIEKNAKEKISRAEKLKEEIIRSAEKEEQHIGGDKLHEAKELFSKLTENERRSVDSKIKEIRENGEAEKSKLDAVFEKRHSEWTESIFSSVIGI